MTDKQWSTPDGQPADKPIHVYPLNDLREHVFDGLWCPCMPKLVGPDPVIVDGEECIPEGAQVIRHNSYDGREVGEVCRRALDSLAVALTNHNHTWPPSLRADYEQAIDLLNLHHPTR